jgi:hypothetical protein
VNIWAQLRLTLLWDLTFVSCKICRSVYCAHAPVSTNTNTTRITETTGRRWSTLKKERNTANTAVCKVRYRQELGTEKLLIYCILHKREIKGKKVNKSGVRHSAQKVLSSLHRVSDVSQFFCHNTCQVLQYYWSVLCSTALLNNVLKFEECYAPNKLNTKNTFKCP